MTIDDNDDDDETERMTTPTTTMKTMKTSTWTMTSLPRKKKYESGRMTVSHLRRRYTIAPEVLLLQGSLHLLVLTLHSCSFSEIKALIAACSSSPLSSNLQWCSESEMSFFAYIQLAKIFNFFPILPTIRFQSQRNDGNSGFFGKLYTDGAHLPGIKVV